MKVKQETCLIGQLMDKRSLKSKDYLSIAEAGNNNKRIQSFVIFIVYNFFKKCLNQPSPTFSMP